MLYTDYLKNIDNCPFCKNDTRAILQNNHAYLTYSLAPYAKYHMLVIPKRHTESLDQLDKRELKDIYSLLSNGAKILEAKIIHDYTILARNGNHTGKSIAHLHFHIIPKHRIGDMNANSEKRKVMTKKQIENFLTEIDEITGKLNLR